MIEGIQELAKSTNVAALDAKLAFEEIETSTNNKIDIDHKQEHVNGDESDLPERYSNSVNGKFQI